MNNFGRGLLDEASYQISKTCLGLLVSDKKIFKVFPYMYM